MLDSDDDDESCSKSSRSSHESSTSGPSSALSATDERPDVEDTSLLSENSSDSSVTTRSFDTASSSVASAMVLGPQAPLWDASASRQQQTARERMSMQLRKRHSEAGPLRMAEVFELFMRWKEKNKPSFNAASQMWDLLGLCVCPPGEKWPVLKTLTKDIPKLSLSDGFVIMEVCPRECKQGLFAFERANAASCLDCQLSRRFAKKFRHRRYSLSLCSQKVRHCL